MNLQIRRILRFQGRTGASSTLLQLSMLRRDRLTNGGQVVINDLSKENADKVVKEILDAKGDDQKSHTLHQQPLTCID